MILKNGLIFERFWRIFLELNDIPKMMQGIATPFKSEPTRCDSFMLPFFPSLSQILQKDNFLWPPIVTLSCLVLIIDHNIQLLL